MEEQTLEVSWKNQNTVDCVAMWGFGGTKGLKGLKGLKEQKVHPLSVFAATKGPLKVRILEYPLQILLFVLGFFDIKQNLCDLKLNFGVPIT
jgi:hypothetical protein